jgi:drug/metabolite transporter (DMT)-like permease
MSTWFLISLASAVTFGLSGFLMKVSSARSGDDDFLLWGLYLTGSLGFVWWAVKTGDIQFTWLNLAAGTLVGIGSAFGNLLFMRALSIGPASLTSPLANANIILTMAMSMLVYGESITVTEATGAFLLVSAIMLLPVDPNENLRIQNRRWYLLIFLAMLLFFFRNGGLKITEEMNLSNTSILLISYLFGWIWFTWQILRKAPPAGFRQKSRRTGMVWGLGAGFFSFAGMQLYAIALDHGPASIIAPIFSTNSLVVALLSILVFRERLSLMQSVSLILLFAGLILIRI